MPIKSTMIAPCGMNCSICYAHLREKRVCPGCRGSDQNIPDSCIRCIIRNCDKLKQGKMKYCFSCRIYPCARLKQLDKRYRTKYGMSMLENLENISNSGIREFIKQENIRWKCSSCGQIICVHRNACVHCGQKRSA